MTMQAGGGARDLQIAFGRFRPLPSPQDSTTVANPAALGSSKLRWMLAVRDRMKPGGVRLRRSQCGRGSTLLSITSSRAASFW
jgi:hypothetical protein